MNARSVVRVYLLPLATADPLATPDPLAPADPLARAVARSAGVTPEEVRITRRCTRCGSDDHGRPLVSHPSTPPWHVSLSRSARQVAVAVTDAAPLGVDLESVQRLDRAPVERVLLHSREREELEQRKDLEQREELAHRAGTARRERIAALWTAKEAVLKALGVGLAVEPSTLWLRRRPGRPRSFDVAEWPAGISPMPMVVHTRRLPDGERLAVAVTAATGIRLLLERG